MVIFNTYVKLPIWVCNSLHHFLANVFNDTWCDQQRGSVVPEAWEHWLTGCCGRSLTNQALSRRLQAGVQESEDENPGYPWFMVTPKRLILVGKWWWTIGFLGFNIFKQCQWETESEERGIKGDFAHGISWITLATQVAELPWQFGFRPQWSCRDCFQSAPRIAATHDRALPDARVQSGWNTCVECETHMLAPRHGLMTSSNHQLTCTYRTCTQLTPNGLLLKAFDWLMLAVHCTAIRKLPTHQSALSIWKHQLEQTDCSCLCSKRSNSTCSPRGQRVPGHLDVGNRCPTAPRSFLRPCFQTMGAPMRPAQHKMHKPDNLE